jgi:hypothetical protein
VCIADWLGRNVGKPLFATIFASWASERRRGDRDCNYTRRDASAALAQKRGLVAIKQQALQGVLGWRVLTLPTDSPLWHNDLNFSLPPEKVSDGRRKTCSLANFFRYKEKLS